MQFNLNKKGNLIYGIWILLKITICFAGFLYILAIFNIFPGYSIPNLGISLWSAGFGDSLSKSTIWGYPPHMGYPLGAPIVFGLPVSVIQAIIQDLFSISSLNAYLASFLLFLFLAYLGIIYLVKKLGGGTIFSSLASVLYLSNSIIWGHLGYGVLALSFALIPTYFLAMWIGAEKVVTRKAKQVITGLAIQVTTVSFALFLDGYGFVMLGVVSLALLTTPLKGNESLLSQGKSFALLISGLLLSFSMGYLLYNLYIPGGATYPVESAGFFRAMAVDLQTLVLPQKGFCNIYDLLGWSIDRSTAQFYGDYSAFSMNFLGIAIFLLPFGVLFSSLNKPLKFSLLLIGIFAFMISLGPDLKMSSYKESPDVEKGKVSYFMPSEEAVFSLGTAKLYSQVPGIKNMRATYRWIVLVKFIIFIFIVSLLIYMQFKSIFFYSFLLLAVLLLENSPDLHKRIENGNSFYKQAIGINEQFVRPLARYVKKGDKVAFYPFGNDFLVNYISPQLEIYSYNVGGDKNVLLSSTEWPKEIVNMRNGKNIETNVLLLSESGQLDLLVVPYLDLLWSAHYWPPREAEVEKGRNTFYKIKYIFEDRFLTKESTYFGVIMLNNPM